MSKINTSDFLEYLYGRLPTEWRVQDQRLGLPLYNYLKSIVYGGMEKNIDLANHFTELTDPVRCPSPFFPALYESIGLRYDQGINEIYHRRIFQNIGELMRRRGSYNSIRYLIRVLTGMECNLDYQRSPIKTYESKDLVSFQGYEKGEITVIEMKGKSVQNTTEGNNLWTSTDNKGMFSRTARGLKVTFFDNGVVYIPYSSTPLSGDWYYEYRYTRERINRLKPGSYRIYCERVTNPYALFKVENKALGFFKEVNNRALTASATTLDLTQELITHPETFVTCGLLGNSGDSVRSGVIRPRVYLDQNTTVTPPFEQYTNLIPSPSIEIEQYPYSAGEVSRGINLLDFRNAIVDGTALGITTHRNPDGSYVSTGTPTDPGINVWFLGNYKIVPAADNSNVLLTLEEGKTYYVQDIVLFTYDGTTVASVNSGTYTCNVKGGFKVTGIRHEIVSETIWKKTFYPMVALASEPHVWEPCYGTTPVSEYEFIVSRGRRNLIPLTNTGKDNVFTQQDNCTFSKEKTPDGKDGLKVTATKAERLNLYWIIPEAMCKLVKPNTTYQLSFDYYASTGNLTHISALIVDESMGETRIEFNAKSSEVDKWKYIEFNAKSSDFPPHNDRLYARILLDGFAVGDYFVMYNLQLHESDLPNEWVPALEDKTAGTKSNDGANLFNADSLQNTESGNTATVSTVGNITTLTTVDMPGTFYSQEYKTEFNGNQLTFSGEIIKVSGEGYSEPRAEVIMTLSSGRTMTNDLYYQPVFTVPSDVTTLKVGVSVECKQNSVYQFKNLMLNRGSIAMPWKAFDPETVFPEPEPVSNYFQRCKVKLSAPLRSCGLINPLRDRLVRTGESNPYKWKVQRYVGVQRLVGTESWSLSLVQGNFVRFELYSRDYDIAGPRMCNKLPYESVYNNTMNYENVHSNPDSGIIGVTVLLSRLKTSDIAGFKEWLTKNNLIVFYGKAYVSYEDLDMDSQKALNTIKAYDNTHTTHMYTISDVTPSLLVQYTGFGRYLFISMLAASIEQLAQMDNSVEIVQRFLTQFVPYYITPIASGEVAQQEMSTTHYMGVIVTESKIYNLVQYRNVNSVLPTPTK